MRWESEKEELKRFRRLLEEQGKSRNTVEKYVRDVWRFLDFLGKEEVSREAVVRYKETLLEKYRVSSVNSMLIAVNCYLNSVGFGEWRVKTCRQQRALFREEARSLEREEYERLVRTAKAEGKERLFCVLQALASTGIRVGELPYLTVESLDIRRVQIDFKGKVRVILLPKLLTVLLKSYCRRAGIRRGSIFVTRSGRPLDRRNLWAEIKELCRKADVAESKGFPHNLRHLFARCFYEKEPNLARLADYLGHSNVETTRRYIMISTVEACEKQLELGLLFVNLREKESGFTT